MVTWHATFLNCLIEHLLKLELKHHQSRYQREDHGLIEHLLKLELKHFNITFLFRFESLIEHLLKLELKLLFFKLFFFLRKPN